VRGELLIVDSKKYVLDVIKPQMFESSGLMTRAIPKRRTHRKFVAGGDGCVV